MWTVSLGDLSKGKARLVAILRVLYTTVLGVNNNNVPSKASALSYTSLLAIGPLISLVILTSSVFLRDKGEQFICEQITNTITFAMPAISQMNEMDSANPINPKITAFIHKISKSGAKSGVIGTLATVVTCILLCVTMENTFNQIWGVKKGRKWVNRIAFYWALISLGSALGIFGMTFLASSQLSSFFKNVPYFNYFASGGTYLVGFGSIALLFTCVYKFLPFTYVKWLPAFCGGAVATLALIANNKMSFIYISTIVKNQNFYGYLAILPIALFSLYVFWLFVLIGAQVSYAVQNMDWISSKFMWEKVTNRSRDLICLAVFAKIAKPFYSGLPAPEFDKIAKSLGNVPKPIVRSCLNLLLLKNIVCETEDLGKDNPQTIYKPSVAPDEITLTKFFELLDSDDADHSLAADLSHNEAIVGKAIQAYQDFASTKYATKTLKELLN